MGVAANSIQIQIVIERPSAQMANDIAAAAQGLQAQGAASPVAFTVNLISGNQSREVKAFGKYVVRELPLTSTVNPDRSIGVAYDPQSKAVSPVPTLFSADGANAALIRNSNSVYTVLTLSKTFADVQGHWAQKNIEKMASKLIVSGVTAQQFAPQKAITRAELAVFVARGLGLQPKNDKEPMFKDVNKSHSSYGYVNTVVELGIMKGYNDQTFKPNAPLTRQEAATILVRAMNLAGSSVAVAQAEQDSLINKFTDKANVQAWAKTGVAGMMKAGIINGYPNKTFQPNGVVTRAEATVMLEKTLKAANFMN